MLKRFLLLFTVYIYISSGAVLIWSNKNVNLSPLQQFDDDDLNSLKETLLNPQVFIFKSPTASLSSDFKSLLDGYHSAFNPNGIVNTEQATELLGDNELDKMKVKQTLDLVHNKEDFLAVLYIPNRRFKREADINVTTTMNPDFKKPEGPVIYIGKSKKDLYTMLYSSKPLLLKVKNEFIYLGMAPADMITVDTRLNVNIPLENGDKISLRFSFTNNNYGYWSMKSVKITDTMNDMNFNLNITTDITAPQEFSYHCTGDTLFVDKANDVELHLYDIQVQIDSTNGKFSDAYDCVPFTTAPIWSGLFVTSILGIGLIVALTAIMDIKTMDKFDNAKTKNLSITVFE